MTPWTLTELQLDLRDIAGVTFVGVAAEGPRTKLQVSVDDPSVRRAVDRTVEDLARRYPELCPEVELHVVGVRRSPLRLDAELRGLDGVESVELRRGRRGELLHVGVVTASPAATERVEVLLDARVGADFRRRRCAVRSHDD